ncbi:DUF1493 family protein [Enterobacter sp. C2]|uniref:DUF1493 family protein n=1 Tax=Enterobacter sp. C2 TaxID=2870346 RepID=UPI001CA39A59|nr:DUF1493 family protein [Enterobacter sp. C2]
MVDNIEQRAYTPLCWRLLFSFEPVELTLESDVDADLYIEDLDASDLMNTFFSELHVDRRNFNIKTYYPDIPFSWNLFKKMEPVPVLAFTIVMLACVHITQ